MSHLHDAHGGPYRTLLDKTGVLAGVTFPWHRPDRDEQAEGVRRVLVWFWHELSHFIAAMGRGQLWWAYGQLEAMRRHCVNLARIGQGLLAEEEPYEKVDQAIDPRRLKELRSTFPAMDELPMLEAAVTLVRFFRDHAPAVARATGLAYPSDLDRLTVERLERLVTERRVIDARLSRR